MPKKNPYINSIEKKYALAFQRKLKTILQMCEDSAVLAAGEVTGLTSEKYEEFVANFRSTVNEISGMILEDAKDDKEIVYTKERVDRALKPVAGDMFIPWEDRYV